MTIATATTDNPLVDARTCHEHIARLVALGLPPRSIAQAAGVGKGTVLALLDGTQRRCHRGVALCVLGVTTAPRPEQDIVLSIGAVRRVHALSAIGWPLAELGRMLRMIPANVSHMSGRKLITYERWAAVHALFGRLAAVPGPSDAARAAALHKGWPPPAAWPPERVDNPSAGPLPRAAWRGAHVDRQAVAECIAGHLPYHRLGRAERAAAIARMTLAGHSPEWTAYQLRTDVASVLAQRDALGVTNGQA